jgi:hypothetical protein
MEEAPEQLEEGFPHGSAFLSAFAKSPPDRSCEQAATEIPQVSLGGICLCLARGLPEAESARLGSLAAAGVITRVGARPAVRLADLG